MPTAQPMCVGYWPGKDIFHEAGSNRVYRGGSWNNNARNYRVATRNWNTPSKRNNNLGLRLVLLAPGLRIPVFFRGGNVPGTGRPVRPQLRIRRSTWRRMGGTCSRQTNPTAGRSRDIFPEPPGGFFVFPWSVR